MYWWNVSKLVEDLREGRVDEKERFKYFIATLVAWNVAAHLFFYSGASFGSLNLLSAILTLSATVTGVLLCYKANKIGDNTDFIAGMICLGWPIGIRLAVIYSVPLLIFAALALRFSPSALQEFFVGVSGRFLFGFCFISGYFCWIAQWLAVSQPKGAAYPVQGKTEWSVGKVALGVLGGIGIVVAFVAYSGWILSVVERGTPTELLVWLPLVLVFLLQFWQTWVWLARISPKRP